MDFKYIKIETNDHIASVYLNNSKKANCINESLWFELGEAVSYVDSHTDSKVIVLRGKGKHFSSGIDFNYLKTIHQRFSSIQESAREEQLHQYLLKMQGSFNRFEACRLPILAMIQGACIGGAVDLISACDMRFCTFKSAFSIMETKLGIVADMGTLQRLRFTVSEAHLRELALTSKIINGRQAYQLGLVNRYFFFKSRMEKYVYDVAKTIACLPPEAVQGSKAVLNFSRNHSIEEGLADVAKRNASALLKLTLPDR